MQICKVVYRLLGATDEATFYLFLDAKERLEERQKELPGDQNYSNR